jgi:hypothetical protein
VLDQTGVPFHFYSSWPLDWAPIRPERDVQAKRRRCDRNLTAWRVEPEIMPAKKPHSPKALWWSAGLLLMGAPILALFSRSWGVGELAFGAGAIFLGIGQIRAGEDRSGRFVGLALVLGGAFTAVDGVIRLLSGMEP